MLLLLLLLLLRYTDYDNTDFVPQVIGLLLRSLNVILPALEDSPDDIERSAYPSRFRICLRPLGGQRSMAA